MTALTPECEKALEHCLSGEEPLPESVSAHLAQCPQCESLAQKLAQDAQLLQNHWRGIEVPPAPVLELRGPLESASGYPRRVSLTVIPFLLILLLLALIGLAALIWKIQTKQNQRGALDKSSHLELEIPQQAESPTPTPAPLK